MTDDDRTLTPRQALAVQALTYAVIMGFVLLIL